MENPFDVLNDQNNTDDRYLDRVEFFLYLKGKEASARAVARDETKDLLKSKNVTTAKLRNSLKGRTQKAPNIDKNYSESAQTVAKRTATLEATNIKKPTAKATAPKGDLASKNKNRVKKLLS